MNYLDTVEIRRKVDIEVLRQAEISMISSLDEGDEVVIPKQFAHKIQGLLSLSMEIGKPLRADGLTLIRDDSAGLTRSAIIDAFLKEHCEIGDELRQETSSLYDAFADYCQKLGSKAAFSRVAFGREMTARGFQYKERSNPEYFSYRTGLRLKEEQNEG